MKEPLVTDKNAENIVFDEDEDKSIQWLISLKSGILNTIIAFFTTLGIVLLLNLLRFGGFLQLFAVLIFMEGVAFFLASSLVIWFGPSPQWAIVKKSVLKKSIKTKSTTESIQIGASRFVTGTLLIIIALI